MKDKGWLKDLATAAKIPPLRILHGDTYDRYQRSKRNIFLPVREEGPPFFTRAMSAQEEDRLLL